MVGHRNKITPLKKDTEVISIPVKEGKQYNKEKPKKVFSKKSE